MPMITEIETFFAQGCGRCARFASADCSARIWADGLAALRAVVRGTGVEEVVKWGHPTYVHAGRNIAVMGALRGDFRLSFFNAALMRDPEGLLVRQGPNTRTPDALVFTSVDQVATRAPLIAAYVTEAMGYAAAGLRPEPAQGDLVLPDELVDALDADSELAEAFARLTKGRQRSYVIALSSAKAAATREARVMRLRGKIMAGKGAQER